jgi:hypothetical protein
MAEAIDPDIKTVLQYTTGNQGPLHTVKRRAVRKRFQLCRVRWFKVGGQGTNSQTIFIRKGPAKGAGQADNRSPTEVYGCTSTCLTAPSQTSGARSCSSTELTIHRSIILDMTFYQFLGLPTLWREPGQWSARRELISQDQHNLF